MKTVKLPLIALAAAALLAAPLSAQRAVSLPKDDKTLTGAPQAVFTVGVEEGESHEVFSAVQGVTFDASGNLYVLDRDNARVVVFSPDGSFLREIGSRGQGPGELQLPTAMAVLPDNRLAIMDVGNGAISIFSAAGRYEAILRPDFISSMPSPSSSGIAAHASGGLLMTAGPIVGGGPDGGPPQARETVPIMLQPLQGESKLMFDAPTPAMVIRATGSAGQQNVSITSPPTFSPTVNWGALKDGRVAVSHGLDYRIELVAATGGSVVAVLERPIKARSVTERDRDAAREAQRERLESGAGQMRVEAVNGRRSVSMGGPGMPPERIEQFLAQMTFAETVPVIRRIRTDMDNRIWVQRDGGSGSTDYPIDILDAAGRYLGTLKAMELPDAVGPNGLLAFIETDDLGVQRVSVSKAPAGWFR